jgi:hypothetical protein
MRYRSFENKKAIDLKEPKAYFVLFAMMLLF